ncbi:anti-repressor protein [Brevundimonas nasdae]|uniref:antA/AntB antirepressor family protein n=1 Tax=Brevundimonas nasdae TaxID=172043 RepID=UPI001912746E|nr:antA/AntB antirepressor family protein [Brevundimonas nasdae]MBK6024546.1 antA/AntB antirepressor family protein [Brevundimonas nasdae]MDQ0453633.1 anti-repressor protein [Brevundimonas nasdae]
MNANDNSFPVVVTGTIGEATVQTVKARDLHAFLTIGKDFSTWIKDRIGQYDFVDGVDYVTYQDLRSPKSGSTKSRPVVATEYAVTIDMAKELAMVERNDQGKRARQYFIECERKAKQVDPVVALNDPTALRGLLLQNVEKVIALEARVEADKPKTGFYDQFVNADGLYGLQNAGRALGCHPNKFVSWLKQDYVFHQGTAVVPRVRFIQMGVFEVKSTIVDDKARPKTFITAKGLTYFASRVPDRIKFASGEGEAA